jgi:hypothetical protein
MIITKSILESILGFLAEHGEANFETLSHKFKASYDTLYDLAVHQNNLQLVTGLHTETGFVRFQTRGEQRIELIVPFKNMEKCVHTEHCCRIHGCKYSDNDCPVYLGQKPQSFSCEDCGEVKLADIPMLSRREIESRESGLNDY